MVGVEEINSFGVSGIKIILDKYKNFIDFKIYWETTDDTLEYLLKEKDDDIKHLYREKNELHLYVNEKNFKQFISDLQKSIQELQNKLDNLKF